MVGKKQVRGPFHEIVVPTDCSSGSANPAPVAVVLSTKKRPVPVEASKCQLRSKKDRVFKAFMQSVTEKTQWQ
jgi:hypothetical protein